MKNYSIILYRTINIASDYTNKIVTDRGILKPRSNMGSVRFSRSLSSANSLQQGKEDAYEKNVCNMYEGNKAHDIVKEKKASDRQTHVIPCLRIKEDSPTLPSHQSPAYSKLNEFKVLPPSETSLARLFRYF